MGNVLGLWTSYAPRSSHNVPNSFGNGQTSVVEMDKRRDMSGDESESESEEEHELPQQILSAREMRRRRRLGL